MFNMIERIMTQKIKYVIKNITSLTSCRLQIMKALLRQRLEKEHALNEIINYLIKTFSCCIFTVLILLNDS